MILFPTVTKIYDVLDKFMIYLFHFVFLLSMQPVVDAFDPRLLISPPMFHAMDFTKIKVGINYFISPPISYWLSHVFLGLLSLCFATVPLRVKNLVIFI
jgi:hypothetical protein